jgi:hypothetical protein
VAPDDFHRGGGDPVALAPAMPRVKTVAARGVDACGNAAATSRGGIAAESGAAASWCGAADREALLRGGADGGELAEEGDVGHLR